MLGVVCGVGLRLGVWRMKWWRSVGGRGSGWCEKRERKLGMMGIVE